MYQRGFTLIELSIVLVIIGLIVGGVLVGQDLIKAAERRAALSQIEEFKTAIFTFRNKYNCLPGDCTTASTFGLGGNGNGDKKFQIIITPSNGYQYEHYKVWQHLGAAGLIEGTYTGALVSSHSAIGQNLPKAPINNAGWNIGYYQSGGSPFGIGQDNARLNGRSTNWLWIGDDNPDYGYLDRAAISPQDGHFIDNKVDDAVLDAGNVRAARGRGLSNPSCYNNADTTAYLVNETDRTCRLFFDLHM